MVSPAWNSCDAAVQRLFENFCIQYLDLQLKGSTWLVEKCEGVLQKDAPGVAYALVDFDGQVRAVCNVTLDGRLHRR